MKTLLVPVDGSANSRHALSHVVEKHREGAAIEVKLLSVQPRFRRHVSQFVSQQARDSYRHEAGRRELEEASRVLGDAGVQHSCHLRVGDRARTIADFARAHRCDEIVMATSRGNWLSALTEGGLTNRVVQLAGAAVHVVPGAPPSKLERFGMPAGVGMGVALMLLAAE